MRHPLQARTSAAHSNLHQGWGLTIMASAAFLQPFPTCSTWPVLGRLPDAARVPLKATEPALPLLRLGRGSNGRYPPPPPSHRPRQPARPARPTAPATAPRTRPTAALAAAHATARDPLPLTPATPSMVLLQLMEERRSSGFGDSRSPSPRRALPAAAPPTARGAPLQPAHIAMHATAREPVASRTCQPLV